MRPRARGERRARTECAPYHRITLIRFYLTNRGQSVRFSLRFDDVGIRACIAVEGPDTVVIERVWGQAGHILTSRIPHVAILIAGNVSSKGIVRGDI